MSGDHIYTCSEVERLLSELPRYDLKEQRSRLRTIGHIAMEIEKAGDDLSVPQMETLSTALMAAGRVHGWPQRFMASNARLMQRRRVALGLGDPAILEEKALTIDVEIGALALWDAETDLDAAFFEAGGQAFCAAMNAGRYFSLALPGDGAIKVRLRSLAQGEPEPMESEFRRMHGATAVMRLHVPSRKVCLWGGGKKRITVQTAETDCFVSAFNRGHGRAQQIVVTVAPSYRLEVPDYHESPNLELY